MGSLADRDVANIYEEDVIDKNMNKDVTEDITDKDHVNCLAEEDVAEKFSEGVVKKDSYLLD